MWSRSASRAFSREGFAGKMMFWPATSSAGSPNFSSMPLCRAKVSWGCRCLPAPVYSVSWATMI